MSTLEKIINAASDLSEEQLKEVLRAVRNARIEDKPSYERLHLIALKMHNWIFLNSGDEQAVYDELSLTDEENAFLGYGGQFTCVVEMPKEGENHAEV
jgi:hypothetical protein